MVCCRVSRGGLTASWTLSYSGMQNESPVFTNIISQCGVKQRAEDFRSPQSSSSSPCSYERSPPFLSFRFSPISWQTSCSFWMLWSAFFLTDLTLFAAAKPTQNVVKRSSFRSHPRPRAPERVLGESKTALDRPFSMKKCYKARQIGQPSCVS